MQYNESIYIFNNNGMSVLQEKIFIIWLLIITQQQTANSNGINWKNQSNNKRMRFFSHFPILMFARMRRPTTSFGYGFNIEFSVKFENWNGNLRISRDFFPNVCEEVKKAKKKTKEIHSFSEKPQHSSLFCTSASKEARL